MGFPGNGGTFLIEKKTEEEHMHVLFSFRLHLCGGAHRYAP